MKKIIAAICLLALGYQSQAQTQTYSNTDPKTGVKVTTKISPLPNSSPSVEIPLEEQIRNLENLLNNARQNPDLVANGTAAKYEWALEQKRQEWIQQQTKSVRIPNEGK